MRSTSRLFLLMLLCTFLLVGCSRATPVYRNLDTLIPGHSMITGPDRTQQRELRQRLREHLAWHCSTQLPELLARLDRLERSSADGQLEPSDLEPHYRGVRDAMHSIAVEVTRPPPICCAH